ncbi:exopolygalacturonase [Boeremia exigua]|uniref:exopolygalacturonase n=1 Tax=Boeremia exigua TaxID=749465 RepID=UPI001E8D7360|nr:exopolygalacturonase [Boeremia exigua]KAH6644374.1 exopolygalacturonase [Boeremia exigua]
MKLNPLSLFVVGCLGGLATATPQQHALPSRPTLKAAPFDTGKAFPHSPPRNPKRRCFVEPGKKEPRDDARAIYKAFEKCNNGGTIILDDIYHIKSPLDLTFLQHIDVVLTGELHFDDDVYHWAEHSFKYDFQNQSVFWKWGGKDVNIYGDLSKEGSLIDGHGEAYWLETLTNKSLRRPMLFAFDGMEGATMSHIRMRNPPNWFNIIANSSDILISNMDLRAESRNKTKIANSDGWDTFRANRLVIQDSVIVNTDDCVSFKPNSTNVVIQNLDCTGSHGISVGSLGQYANVTDIVENLYIYNVSLANSSDGARIKVWPGIETSFQTLLNGGGGLGRVKNVTYDLFRNVNNDRAITITQCYGQKNQSLCYEHPANLTIEDILIKNMYGTTSKSRDPQAGTLICSAPDRCSNIRAENVTVQVPSGKAPVYACRNVDESLLGFDCVAPEGERDLGQG